MKNLQKISTTNYQKEIDGKKVNLYTLSNENGMTLCITNFGATFVNLFVPDKNGSLVDVIFGFDTLDDLINSVHFYIGSTVGRYANRIAKGKFEIDGIAYLLETNNGANHLHGGRNGFFNVVWDVEEVAENQLILSYLSKDGEEGYPGNLKVKATFTLDRENALVIDYEATTDKKTVCNLTNHAYFNLNGVNPASPIEKHILQILADTYTPVDETSIPLGNLATVENTPFDFRQAKIIGKDIEIADEQLLIGNGYDHNFVINQTAMDGLNRAASVYAPETGIQMEIFTTEPGIQFYSGNFLNKTIIGKNNIIYQHRTGFCLETQHFPDSPNQPNFPSTVLEPQQVFKSRSIYKFGIINE